MRANLLPSYVESLILLLVQLLNSLQDLGLVVFHNPLLLHQVIVLQGGKYLRREREIMGFIEFTAIKCLHAN